MYTARTEVEKGCKYKHEFPKDEETQLSIGIRGPPRWLQDDPGLKRQYWPASEPVEHTGS